MLFDFLKGISREKRITRHGKQVQEDFDAWAREQELKKRKSNLTQAERDYWYHRFVCPRQGRGCPSCAKEPPTV